MVNRTRNIIAVSLLGALLLPAFPGHAVEPPPKKVNELMKEKLQHSQKLLEALALNKYDQITQNSRDLIRISQLAGWKVLKTPQYQQHSNRFRRSAETMIRHAKAKNVEAATLAYVEMTLTCIQCHQHVREVRMAGLDVPARDTVALGE